MSEIVANRVGTFAQRSSLVQQMMTTQKRLYETQVQLATEQKSQDYAGVSYDSFRLVSIETERTMVQRFSQGNSIAQVRLETMTSSVEAVETRLHDLRDELLALKAHNIESPLTDEDRKALDDIQDFAFAALQDMSFYLNARADGRYVFAGGRTDQQAVDLPYRSLAEFQTEYNGVDVVYPDTRDAHVSNVKLTNDEHDGLTFGAAVAPNDATITAAGTAPAGIFNDIPVGSIIKIEGSDQYFRVTANLDDDRQISVQPDPTTVTPAPDVNGTLESVSYYNGDDLEFEHRVNERRTITLGVNAKDPAFEKAIRAMGILSQGGLYNFVPAGTSGDLTFNNGAGSVTAANAGAFANIPVGAEITFDVPEDDPNFEQTFTVTGVNAAGDELTLNPAPNDTAPQPVAIGPSGTTAFMPDRIEKALDLIDDAIDHDPNSTEKPNDIKDVARLIGFNHVTLDTAVDEALNYDAFLEKRQVEIEQVNTIDAATRLQDDARALEVSFQSYARISQLSLMNFM